MLSTGTGSGGPLASDSSQQEESFVLSDELDYLILKTVHEVQQSTPHVLGAHMLKHLESRDPSGLEFMTVANRVDSLIRSNYLDLTVGQLSDVRRPPGMYAVVVTPQGEAALKRGPEKLRQEQSVVADNRSYTFNNSGGDAYNNTGDASRQTNQSISLNMTVGHLFEALERSVEEAQIPSEQKSEVKDLLEKAKAALPSQITGLAITQLPAVATWLGHLFGGG